MEEEPKYTTQELEKLKALAVLIGDDPYWDSEEGQAELKKAAESEELSMNTIPGFHIYIAKCQECKSALNGDEDVYCKFCWEKIKTEDSYKV